MGLTMVGGRARGSAFGKLPNARRRSMAFGDATECTPPFALDPTTGDCVLPPLPPLPGGGGGTAGPAGPQTYNPDAWDLSACTYTVQEGDTPVQLATFCHVLNYQGSSNPIHGLNIYNPPAGLTDSKGFTNPKVWYPGAKIKVPPEGCTYVAGLPCPPGFQPRSDGKPGCEAVAGGGGGGDGGGGTTSGWTTTQKVLAGVAVVAGVTAAGTLIWYLVKD